MSDSWTSDQYPNDRLDMHALADGELAGEALLAAQRKKDESRELRAEYESVIALKGALQKVEPQTSPQAWQKCRDRLGEFEKRSAVEGFVGRFSWALCTIFFALILGAGLFNRAFDAGGIRTGDAARMLSGLAPVSQPAESAPVEMSAWIRPPQGSEIRVTGYAVGRQNGHPVRLLHFEDARGRFSVLAIRGVNRVEGVEPMLEHRAYSAGRLNGTNCITWSDEADALFLVGERPYEELARLADQMREE
jgi:anti-sigma factor RsiW